MLFIEYQLTSESLYLGERAKGEIFKPCLKTIPFSQITGALNTKFGLNDLKAVGYLLNDSRYNNIDYLTYAPKDRNLGISKLPLRVEFLTNVVARVFILKNKAAEVLPEEFEISVGGLKSKGFGRCSLKKVNILDANKVDKGILNVRIPIDEKDSFNIKNVIKPIYGYLFRPKPKTFTGNYILSLFEGSEVVAPTFLLRR
jgi:hypothetical protein